MTKADLVDQIITLGDLTRRDGEVIVETLFDSIVEALKSSDKVEVRGFGSFRTRQRQPRTGRNPKTGDAVAVPAKRVPFFKPSKELRDLVNPGEAKAQRRGAAAKHGPNSSEVVDVHHPPAM
jgi:integration host factor subunit beta